MQGHRGPARTALARELQWLASILPLGNGNRGVMTRRRRSGRGDRRDRAARAAVAVADEAITRALAAVGLQRGVDRAYYYELDEGAGTLALTHEWHAAHLRPMKSAAPVRAHAAGVLPPPFLASLRRGGVVRVPRTHQFLGAPGRRAGRAPTAIARWLLMPVVVDGVLIGIAGFAAAVGSTWEQADLDLLQVVAQGVARTVERKRVDDALYASEARFRAMCDASPLGIFLAGAERRGLYLNAAGQRIIGLTAGGDDGTRLDERAPPRGSRARVVAHWGTAVEARDRLRRRRSIASSTRTATCARSRCARSRSPANPTASACSASSRTSPTGCAPSRERQDLLRAHRGGACRGRGGPAGGRGGARRRRRDPVAHLRRVRRAGPRRPLHLRQRPRAVALCGRTRDEMIGQHRLGRSNPPARSTAPCGPRSSRRSRSSGRSPSRCSAAAVRSRCGCTRRRPGVSFFFEDISDRKRAGGTADQRPRLPAPELGRPGRRVGDRRLVAGPAPHDGTGARWWPRTNTTVLITGETGTGKELVARAIHERSPRARAAVRRGQLRGDLAERCSRASCSATRRARSPARSRGSTGRFELADGGTLFLDEIGELPLDAAGQAAARAAGARVRARRRHRDDPASTCASSPRPTATSRRWSRDGHVPRGPLLPPERRSRSTLPPLRERARGHPAAGRALPARATRARRGKRVDGVSPRGAAAPARATPGRATCASWRT